MIAALCVVVALGASVTIPAAAERTSLMGALIEKVQTALLGVAAPEAKPLLAPLPRPKPDRSIAKSPDSVPGGDSPESESDTAVRPTDPPKPGIEIVAKCGYATIISKPYGKGKIYRATFAKEMVDEMAGKGCVAIQRGCNICKVSYVGCDDAVKAACKDADCLMQKCERKIFCSSKLCTVEGEAPTCESRIAQSACKKSLFDSDG